MANAVRSGQITVTTAGTAVAGPSTPQGTLFAVRALAGNSGVVYVGNDGAGDVTSANGFELSAGDTIIIEVGGVGSLANFYFDSASNGDKLCWLKIG